MPNGHVRKLQVVGRSENSRHAKPNHESAPTVYLKINRRRARACLTFARCLSSMAKLAAAAAPPLSLAAAAAAAAVAVATAAPISFLVDYLVASSHGGAIAAAMMQFYDHTYN